MVAMSKIFPILNEYSLLFKILKSRKLSKSLHALKILELFVYNSFHTQKLSTFSIADLSIKYHCMFLNYYENDILILKENNSPINLAPKYNCLHTCISLSLSSYFSITVIV